MNGSIYWIIPVVSLLYIGVLINLIRTRRLLETHALLWLVTFLGLMVSPFLVPLLDRVAHAVGIHYPPTFYLLIAIFILMANALKNTLDVSRLTEMNRKLTQETALLRREIRKASRNADGRAEPD